MSRRSSSKSAHSPILSPSCSTSSSSWRVLPWPHGALAFAQSSGDLEETWRRLWGVLGRKILPRLTRAGAQRRFWIENPFRLTRGTSREVATTIPPSVLATPASRWYLIGWQHPANDRTGQTTSAAGHGHPDRNPPRRALVQLAADRPRQAASRRPDGLPVRVLRGISDL